MEENQPHVDQNISAANAAWTFGGSVPEHFQTHVEKSVPLYKEGHDLILKIADFFLSNNSTCYDIGCSTGELTNQLAKRFENKNVKVIGVDSETSMIQKAKNLYQNKNVEFLNEDLDNLNFQKSDLIISYYTFQFIHPQKRQEIFKKIYQSLNWGGAFIFFEKVRGPDARFQDISTSLYTDYKLEQGYSPEQIITKSKSLKGILEPFTTQANLDYMSRAGFVDYMSIMKYVCFEGFLAIK